MVSLSDLAANPELLLAYQRQQEARRRAQQAQQTDAPRTAAGAWMSALSQGLANFQAARADQSMLDTARQQRDAEEREMRDFVARLGGGAPAPAAPGQAMPEAPRMVPPLPNAAPRGEAPAPVVQGIAARAALDPNSPTYAEDIQRINNGVMSATLPGAPPQPVTQEAPAARLTPAPMAGGPDPALLMAMASQNPRMRAMAAAMFQQQNQAQARAEQLRFRAEDREDRQREAAARLAEMRASRPPEALVPVMRDGQPVLLPRSQAAGMAPYSPTPQGSQAERDERTLVGGNPASPEYAMAYQRQFGPRIQANGDGSITTIQPQVPPGIRAPTWGMEPAAQPAPGPQAAAQAPMPQAPVGEAPPATVVTPAQRPEAAPTVTATPGGTVTRTAPTRDAPLNENQSRSNLFGLAMNEGHRILQEVEVPSTAAQLLWRNAPEGAVNMGLSENDQRYFNAVRQFAAGVLRKETGAAFTAQELLDVQSRFFPMPGDTIATRQQKARARQQAIEAMRVEVPGGFRGQLPAPAPATEQGGGWSIRPVQ